MNLHGWRRTRWVESQNKDVHRSPCIPWTLMHLTSLCSLIGTRTSHAAFCILNSSFSHFGGVLDSTLGWSAPLPFEDEGWPRKSSFKKIIGNYEAMPLAA